MSQAHLISCRRPGIRYFSREEGHEFLRYWYNFTKPLSRRELLGFTPPSAKLEDHFLHRLASVELFLNSWRSSDRQNSLF